MSSDVICAHHVMVGVTGLVMLEHQEGWLDITSTAGALMHVAIPLQ